MKPAPAKIVASHGSLEDIVGRVGMAQPSDLLTHQIITVPRRQSLSRCPENSICSISDCVLWLGGQLFFMARMSYGSVEGV